jgi:predicted hydrolase (HD superfamily)
MGLTGMLHDFDYEMYPKPPDHPLKGSEVLKERGYSDEIRNAILGHANYTGVARDTVLARGLYACDELTGFVIAAALYGPTGYGTSNRSPSGEAERTRRSRAL